jgi:outer membrane protein
MRKLFVAGAALGLFSILALGAPLAADAQDIHIGYTDHEIIIVNMPAYKEIRQQLETEYTGTQEALQSLAQDFQADVEKYQKQQALLSEERRAQREQELSSPSPHSR